MANAARRYRAASLVALVCGIDRPVLWDRRGALSVIAQTSAMKRSSLNRPNEVDDRIVEPNAVDTVIHFEKIARGLEAQYVVGPSSSN